VAKPSKPNPVMGALRFERRGLKDSTLQTLAKDAYHFLRRASWTRLTLAAFGLYVVMNLVFALILWIGDARILEADRGFWDKFWFSVETMATIGYGHMAPGDALSHVVVTVESFVGLMYTALLTGVVFGKFSVPSAKVLFADHAVICDEAGVPTLMFRCANARSTALVEAQIRVAWTREEILPHGERARRIYDLPLRRNTSPVFALSWTVYHKIDESSPLWGRTTEELKKEAVAIIITMTGIDDSLAATVHTRHSYDADHIQWGQRYVDILKADEVTGVRYIDFEQFHATVPAPVTMPRIA
jgi:inward rectifier potassium channel